MRTTISIPDEYYKRVKKLLDVRGYNSFNEYLLDLIRQDDHQIDAGSKQGTHQIDANPPLSQHQIDAPKVYKGISMQNEVTEITTAVPQQPQAVPGKTAACPQCGVIVPIPLAGKHYMDNHEV